uniref:Uncharacterized protein n=1 Tax=Panagrolaimus sp. JU765 TaxID=591449 RepID=A0AC34PV30_9BILA
MSTFHPYGRTRSSTSITEGIQAFKTKSLLNKRGSSCFSVGAVVIRLQDFIGDYPEPVVWMVTNHNLLQRCTFVTVDSRYHVFKPTTRYIRWLPQFPREYMLMEEMVTFISKDGDELIAVVLPDNEKLQLHIKHRDNYRSVSNLPSTEKGLQPDIAPFIEESEMGFGGFYPFDDDYNGDYSP